MSSTTIALFAPPGTSQVCTERLASQINKLSDSRFVVVKNFEQMGDQDPCALIVAPGGNFSEMWPGFLASAEKIRRLVFRDTGYLGSCAGAIGASERLLLPNETFPGRSGGTISSAAFDYYEEFQSAGGQFDSKSFLGIFPSSSYLLPFRGSSKDGAISVCSSQESESRQLFFNSGVCFLGGGVFDSDTRKLLYAEDFLFKDVDLKTTQRPAVAAVFQPKQGGKVLVTGVHPELTSDPIPPDMMIPGKPPNPEGTPDVIMKGWLNELGILLKP